MYSLTDTIIACSSPPGRGAISIIRISGGDLTELLKKIGIYNFFEYVAGGNTFDFCKPDPRHITNMVEIMGGDISKTIMIGDSENDADAAKSAGVPMILVEDGYTEKKIDQIYHNHLIKDFEGLENIVLKYLND